MFSEKQNGNLIGHHMCFSCMKCETNERIFVSEPTYIISVLLLLMTDVLKFKDIIFSGHLHYAALPITDSLYYFYFCLCIQIIYS